MSQCTQQSKQYTKVIHKCITPWVAEVVVAQFAAKLAGDCNDDDNGMEEEQLIPFRGDARLTVVQHITQTHTDTKHIHRR